jgi:chemotaxis family two-component system sensor histidine kinase/response regulator PixL
MLKILLIEDDCSLLFTLQKLLECLGYSTITAENGGDGLLQYEQNPSIDIILCDIDIPLLDGFQFLQRLQQGSRKVPSFAFISAYVDLNVVQKTKAIGADCVIKKPIDQEILKIILLALYMKHELNREIPSSPQN